MDLLDQGRDWFASQRKTHNSRAIIYRPIAGGNPIPVEQATIGRTMASQSYEYGVVLKTPVRDYLIDAGDLPAPPEQGDIIVDQGIAYQVGPIGDEPPWRWTDGYRRVYRIHAQEIGPA